MQRNLLVLPGGTEIFSGTAGQSAIRSVTVTQCVNSTEELEPGAVCADMLEAEIFSAASPTLAAGDEVVLYRVDPAGKRTQVGIFLAEKPVWERGSVYKLTAYDKVSKLDRDLSQWLAGLTGWPYRLLDFASMVCTACGLLLINDTLPNEDYPVQKFSAEGITGRQLMQWVGQAAGRFCRATADGKLEFAWYTPRELRIGPAGSNYYYQGSLRMEDHQTAPVEKVQIRLTETDVGAVYPDTEAEGNLYALSGNYLLTTGDRETLEPVAQTLYTLLRDVTYTPCTLEVPASLQVNAGDIVTVTDRNGKTRTVYVMTRIRKGQRDRLECTGNARRDCSTAVNNRSWKALSGKVLELRTDVEGLKAENRDAAGKTAGLALTVEGITADVSRQQSDMEGLRQQMTGLQQTAEQVSIRIQSLQENGTDKVRTEMGYTFDDRGLKIRRDGGEIENLLDNTGMYVRRGTDTVLQANNEGVEAINITVRNYLTAGSHARFEDYNNGTDQARTACFYI